MIVLMLENFDDLDSFRAEIENFLEVHKMSARRFGEESVGWGAFVLRQRRGQEPMLKTMRTVREYMNNYIPPQPKQKRKLTRAERSAMERKGDYLNAQMLRRVNRKTVP